jgi:hypothetical protein
MVSGVWAATATYMPDAGSSSVYSPATNSAMVTVTGGASGFTLSGNSVTVTCRATSPPSPLRRREASPAL